MGQIKSMKKNKSRSNILEEHSSMVNNVTLDEPVKKESKIFGEDFETGNLSDELNKYLEE